MTSRKTTKSEEGDVERVDRSSSSNSNNKNKKKDDGYNNEDWSDSWLCWTLGALFFLGILILILALVLPPSPYYRWRRHDRDDRGNWDNRWRDDSEDNNDDSWWDDSPNRWVCSSEVRDLVKRLKLKNTKLKLDLIACKNNCTAVAPPGS